MSHMKRVVLHDAQNGRLLLAPNGVGISESPPGELAVRIGVSQAAIAKLEKPNARPHRVTLKKIAEALGNP
jgi:predicted transcriptional regulator